MGVSLTSLSDGGASTEFVNPLHTPWRALPRVDTACWMLAMPPKKARTSCCSEEICRQMPEVGLITVKSRAPNLFSHPGLVTHNHKQRR